MKLYRMIADLGKKAGVEGCHPHRFRDSLAVTILAGGGTIYDVAKVLGDTVDTVERCYAPFTEQLQERVRDILGG
jgi:integrase